MKGWIAVATALVALFLVPSALAGGDHEGSDRDAKSYQGEKRGDDGDRRDHGYRWSRDDDEDDEGDDDDKGDRGHKGDKGDDDHGEHPRTKDACPNIEGFQSAVPSFLVKDAGGKCVAPTITVTSAPVAQAAPALVAAQPSAVQTTQKAVTKLKTKIKKKKKAKRAKAKRAARRGVKGLRGKLPRVLPFTR